MANEPIIGEDKTIEKLEEKYDPTEARRKRCEPVIKDILQKMLDSDLLLSDTAYIEQRVIEYLQALFQKVTYDHSQLIFETLVASLGKAVKDANEILWEKDSDDVTLKDIDKICKSEVK